MRPRRRQRIRAAVAVLAVLVTLLTMGASAPDPMAQPCPPGTGYPLPTPITADPIRASVHQIGIYDFDTTYLSVTSTGPHTLLIEDTAHVPAFFQAISKIRGIGRYTIHERIVPYSFQSIDDLMYRIADDAGALARQGVVLSAWSVDRSIDRVRASLLVPGCEGVTTVPPASVRRAQRIFDARYGAGVVVVSGVGVPETHAD